ncbi:hypothetical protein N7463_005359 [Penicillium fimorum]|uniref:Uncharacterized protein n=1 Tax=Penicillium fimorum TaxID=1882269 RepID=A0A9W9XTW5_9EURO|nr:hypothetical protein N7463_005359 [Penicillium fimorum]
MLDEKLHNVELSMDHSNTQWHKVIHAQQDISSHAKHRKSQASMSGFTCPSQIGVSMKSLYSTVKSLLMNSKHARVASLNAETSACVGRCSSIMGMSSFGKSSKLILEIKKRHPVCEDE